MHRIYLWFRSIFLRARLEREMRDEMALHIDQSTARHIARGMSPVDAAKEAQREFGNVVYLQEQARDARGKRWIDAIKGDIRFAFRHFRRTPLSTSTMVVVLALGIAVNVGVFTAFHSIWTSPLPGIARDPALVRIRGLEVLPRAARLHVREVAHPEVMAYASQRQIFADVAASTGGFARISSADPERPAATAGSTYVSDNYFSLLRVRPDLGNLLGAASADPDAHLVAVINYGVWEALFDRAPDVIGRVLRVNDVAVTIVGVAPAAFRGDTEHNYANRVWLPLAAYPLVEKSGYAAFTSLDSALFNIVARLQRDVSPTEATSVATALARRAHAQRTDQSGGEIATADVVPLRTMNASPNNEDEMRLAAAGFGVLALLLLLVTCTNVSSLLTGMAVARRREIAIRLSLGAGRRRIVGQLLTESVLIALTAAAFAVLVIWLLIAFIKARFPEVLASLPLGEQLFYWPATLFTAGIALFTALLFGLSPALHATRLALADVLKDSTAMVSGSRSRLHRILVVTQITLTQPLLVAVGATVVLALADMRGVMESELDERLVTMSFNPLSNPASRDATRDDLRRVRDRLTAVPGVAGVTSESYDGFRTMFVHPSDAAGAATFGNGIDVRARYAPPGFLALRDVPIIRGRDFTVSETDSIIKAVIIGDDLARTLFGTADPIGRRVRFPRDSTYVAIVGVVGEERANVVRRYGGNTDEPLVFIPASRALESTLMIRTHGPGLDMIPSLREAAHDEAPRLPIASVFTLQSQKEETKRALLRASAAIGGGGIVALFLAAIGLYAIVAFAVNQRTREIGIRTALGAQRRQVVGLFFLSGVRLSLLGMLLGLPLSLIGLRALTIGMRATEDISYFIVAGVVALGVLLIAGLATWIPARRAAGIDPVQALRTD